MASSSEGTRPHLQDSARSEAKRDPCDGESNLDSTEGGGLRLGSTLDEKRSSGNTDSGLCARKNYAAAVQHAPKTQTKHSDIGAVQHKVCGVAAANSSGKSHRSWSCHPTAIGTRLGLQHWNAFWHHTEGMNPIPGARMHFPTTTTPPVFDLQFISGLAPSTPYNQLWSTLLRFLNDEKYITSLVENFLHANPHYHKNCPGTLTTALTIQEELTLTNSPLFVVAGEQDDLILGSKLLLRGEPHKQRNRLLGWTHLLNEAIKEEMLKYESPIGDCVRAAQIDEDGISRTFDVEKAFFGFRCAEKIAKFAATKLQHTGIVVYPKYMNMGYRPAADICHCSLAILA
jgi:hypothetical protein